MASNFSWDVSVLGSPELTKIFRSLSRQAGAKILRPSLRKGAKLVLATARANAPRGPTGATAANIKLKASTRRGTVSVRVQTGSREAMGIPKAAKYYYPAALELGTEDLAARPWLRPALESNRSAALAEIGAEAWRRVEALGMGRQPAWDGGD